MVGNDFDMKPNRQRSENAKTNIDLLPIDSSQNLLKSYWVISEKKALLIA